MATILDKDLVRESTVKHNDREIQVTLTADQQISFKLKGMKSGALTIAIKDLYEQLSGDGPEPSATPVVAEKVTNERVTKDNPMLSLHELRSKINTTPMPMETKAMFDGFMAQCIKEVRKPFLDKEANDKAKISAEKKLNR